MSDPQERSWFGKHSNLVGFILCFLIAYILIYIPVWQLIIIPGVIAGLIAKETGKCAIIGLLGVVDAWGLYAVINIIAGDVEVLFDQIGMVIIGSEGMGFIFIILSIVIGGVIGMFGAIIGCSIRKLMQHDEAGLS